ncbi:MAG: hypothetical protein JST90_16845 [Bacteroidetes bacterium]|nr:hypothetical protein [Bacteroidota bacterium]
MKFSRERLYQISKIEGHQITPSFKYDSKSNHDYGNSITIDLIVSDELQEELLANIKEGKNTSGVLYAEILAGDKKHNERLKTVGFHTDDIYEVY